MSYLIYINGSLIEAPNVSFAQTKQVNDIANLSTRNSNYTQTIKIQRTATNKKIFDGAFFVGSNSTFPYTKADCDVIDTDTGQHVIYKGWAVLLESTINEYNITIYDGIIDFYRAIDNLTITECGVTELNHIKNIDNVIETWTDEALPYRYILADYNGNNEAGTDVSIDFQVPSANVPYLIEKIFTYISWDYEGVIFSHEYFENLWMTYPKPVSEEEPTLENVTTQESIIVTNTVEYPLDGGTFFGSASFASFFPDTSDFDSDYYIFGSGAVISGTYRLSFGASTFRLQSTTGVVDSARLRVTVLNNVNALVSEAFINIRNGNYADVFLSVGDKILVELVYEDIAFPFTGASTPTSTSILTGEFGSTSFDFISGFSLGFDEAFIDFKVSDFIKEIVVRFGLTMFKDKYSNKVKFLTLSELLQSSQVNNLTSKFIGKVSEKYTFGNYAKSNVFRYKHNDTDSNFANGSINISNENLAEELTIIQSQIYTHEGQKSSFLAGSNVYKIWDKEIKEDDTIEYKGLENRFYFMRAEKVFSPLGISSNILGGGETVPFYFRENYYRLSFNEILFDWYRPIGALFNKAKMILAEFYLKPVDVYNFAFDKIQFIEQLSSYYLVNKIPNIVKGKPTKLELIEVDYMTEVEVINPTTPDYSVVVSEPNVTDCELTINITTDYPLPTTVTVNVYEAVVTVLSEIVFTQRNIVPPLTATLSGTTITIPIDQLPFNLYGYKFGITINTDNPFVSFSSNLSETVFLDGSCFIEPDFPTTLVLNSVTNLGLVGGWLYPNLYNYRVNYSHTGIPNGQDYTLTIEGFSVSGFPLGWNTIGIFSKVEGTTNELTQDVNGDNITKIRIRINDVTSNEITL